MSTLQTDGPNVSDTFSGSETVVDLAVPSKSGNKLLKAEEAVAAPVADAEAQREGPKRAEIKLKLAQEMVSPARRDGQHPHHYAPAEDEVFALWFNFSHDGRVDSTMLISATSMGRFSRRM